MFDTSAGRDQLRMPNNCHGIIHEGRLLLTDSNFREACNGLDTRLVARALDAACILHRNDDQYKPKVSIAALGISKMRYYDLQLMQLFDGEGLGESVPPTPTTT